MTFSPYQPLEVIEVIDVADRRGGHRFFVRDDDDAQFWLLVEYFDGHLRCWCDDGCAHSESPDTEAECRHLRAVVDQRMAQQQSSRPHGVIRPSAFVD